MAMGSRVNPHLALSPDGKTVTVKGPTGEWDSYAVGATFVVVIGQVDPQSGKIVLAFGRSTKTYVPADTWWSATAKVRGANAKLLPGMATAWAVASVAMKDGMYEPIEWSVPLRLIDKPPLP